jgi:hypothetical protein
MAVAAVWAAIAHFTAGADILFLVTFATTAFFLFMASALTGRRWMALTTALAVGALSMQSASVAGPGTYKLLLFAGAGAVFELFCSLRKDGWPFLGALAATASMPVLMWVLSGAGTLPIDALIDSTVLALAAGASGAVCAYMIWGRLAHTKAVIKFQCAGSARSVEELKKLTKWRKRGKRFNSENG